MVHRGAARSATPGNNGSIVTSAEQRTIEDGLCVVVVSYGSPTLLHDALDGLGGAYRTIVVDNSSSPEAKAVAEEAGALYVDPGENVGYAQAVNLALARRRAGDDVLLLNPDACISPPAIERMRTVLHARPTVACVTPAQHTSGSDQLSPAWWPWHTPGKAWAGPRGSGGCDRPRASWEGRSCSSAGPPLDDVGPLDERYFLYSEDEDWQRRAVNKGWSLHHCPEVKAVHGGGRTESDLERLRLRCTPPSSAISASGTGRSAG